MDILYVLGDGSKWDNNELRLSLRSIEKFGKNVGRVFLVGHDPHFLSDKVTYIPYQDNYRKESKQKNILEAICYTATHSDISEEFLYSSDDHIYIKETDFDNYPFYCQGKLPIKGVNNYWNISLYNTRKLLEKYGLPSYDFSCHCNTHVFKEVIRKYVNIIEEAQLMMFGCEPTCLLLNLAYQDKGFEITSRSDLKIHNSETVKDLFQRIKDREVISTSEEPHESVRNYLLELFPEKSKYEK